MLIFLNLPTDLDASEQLQNFGVPVPGAALSEDRKCAINPPSWTCLTQTNLSADPHVNFPAASEDTPGSSTAPFPENLISTFFPVDTDAINEGTCDEPVVQVPAIYAIIDITINTMLLADVPGECQLNYLTT